MAKLNEKTYNFIINRLGYFWRQKLENGEPIRIEIIHDSLKQLKRWGNRAIISVMKGGEVIENNLIENTWELENDINIENAPRSAAIAIDYLVYDKENCIVKAM